MPKKSAGLLLYRERPDKSLIEILLVHPGGPFWRNKDDGAWTIPKGEFADDEDPLAAAKREFREETGNSAPESNSFAANYIALKPIKQSSAKMVYAWAVRSDFDVATLRSNEFEMEWPPKSGRLQKFPEIDRAEWFTVEIARQKMLKGQLPLLQQLLQITQSQRPGG